MIRNHYLYLRHMDKYVVLQLDFHMNIFPLQVYLLHLLLVFPYYLLNSELLVYSS